MGAWVGGEKPIRQHEANQPVGGQVAEHPGLPSSPTHLVINGVELGEQNAVNGVRGSVSLASCTSPRSRRQVNEALVELGQLVDSIVADKSFTYKQHLRGNRIGRGGGQGGQKDDEWT